MDFRETILRQIKEYLDGNITKEEYYQLAEPYYSQYADSYKNKPFHDRFLSIVADACLIYIDEPGLSPETAERQFYQALCDAYEELQKL